MGAEKHIQPTEYFRNGSGFSQCTVQKKKKGVYLKLDENQGSF